MSLQLGEIAPDFTLDSTEGPIQLHDYIGDHWLVFFSQRFSSYRPLSRPTPPLQFCTPASQSSVWKSRSACPGRSRSILAEITQVQSLPS